MQCTKKNGRRDPYSWVQSGWFKNREPGTWDVTIYLVAAARSCNAYLNTVGLALSRRIGKAPRCLFTEREYHSLRRT